MTSSKQNQPKEIIWKSLFSGTVEYTTIAQKGSNFEVLGFIMGKVEGQKVQVMYQIKVDRHWNLLEAEISKAGEKTIHIIKNENHQWFWSGDLLPEWQGIKYIDINLTPFTNTLPINHIQFAPQQSEIIQVIYIDLLKMKTNIARQRYTRLNASQYLYEGLDTDFSRVISVDADGIVTDYPGIWQRMNLASNN